MNRNANFEALWTMMVGAATQVGNDRAKAVLLNHMNKKEYFCRRMGVICSADVKRFYESVKPKTGS